MSEERIAALEERLADLEAKEQARSEKEDVVSKLLQATRGTRAERRDQRVAQELSMSR